MRKSTFIPIFFISFLLLSSIVYALSLKNIVPLDIISSFISNILGTTSTTTISVDSSKVIGTNKLSLGFMTDWSWQAFISNSARRQLVKDANFKLVRVFDFRSTSPRIMPCSNWNTATDNCTLWNWTEVDSYTQAVFGIGAEPMFTLSWPNKNLTLFLKYIPPNMPINSTTGLPKLKSYATYAAEWVKHFNQKGWPVRYYEIGNEPFAYFGWNSAPSNILNLSYFIDLWNAAARAMRQQNPNILLSHDAITQKNVLDYWLQYGDNVDYLDFHKYDCGTWNKSSPNYYSDSVMFGRAESSRFESVGSNYGVKDAQQKWLTSRGKLLPVINSESNLNSAWEGGTDPRIQQMTGAVWKALELRKAILSGVSYSVYYEFSSSSSTNAQSGGHGFGMINSYNNKPWYPYYVQKWIGNNLNVGDNLVQSTSSSNNIRTLSWINNGKLNIFLIHNSTATETVSLNGVAGQLNYQKIDDPSGTSYLINATVQTGTIDASSPITLNGYTVMLLQSSTTPTSTTTIPQQESKLKGIQWYYDSSLPSLSSTKATQSLNNLSYYIPHANYVYLDFWVNRTGNTVIPDYNDERDYKSAIEKARVKNYKIAVRIRHRPGPSDFVPTNVSKWFQTYTQSVVYWANFSQYYGVELFGVGAEINRLDSDNYSSYWRSLISQVRNVYSGKVWYNTKNWDCNYTVNCGDLSLESRINASWFKSLDYIGVSSYWSTCTNLDNSADEMTQNWYKYVGWGKGNGDMHNQNIVNSLKNLSETHGKPIIIVTGLASARNTTVPESACQSPWAWGWETFDLNVQNNWYESVFRVFNDKPWVYGYLFDGGWWTEPNKRLNPNNPDFTVQGKPAEQTIEKWFSSSPLTTTTIRSTTTTTIIPANLDIRKYIYGGCPQWSAQDYVTYSDAIQAHYDSGMTPQRLHSIRSDFKYFLYRNIRDIYYSSSEFNTFKNNGWLLKNSTGGYITSNVYATNYFVDIGNVSYQKWLVEWFYNQTLRDNYDAFFLDEGLYPTANNWYYVAKSKPINPRTGLVFNDSDVVNAYIQIYRALKTKFGNKIVVANGIETGEKYLKWGSERKANYIKLATELDGFMSEHWLSQWTTDMKYIYYPETDTNDLNYNWKDSIDMLVDFDNLFSGKNIIVVGNSVDNQTWFPTVLSPLTTFEQKKQYSNYIFASLLLGISSKNTYWLNLGCWGLKNMQNLFKTDVGSPLGKYYMIPNTHVYARDFSKVKVLVNSNNTTYTVNIGSGYKTLEGAPVSSITMNAHTGEILLKTTPTPTSTSTTTTIPSGFTGTNFICNYVQTNNLWECSLDYTNNLNEMGKVKFHFIDSATSEVKSTGIVWANTGSSTVGSELSCNSYHGTYNVVWRTYRASDTSYSNPVAMSTSFKTITCS